MRMSKEKKIESLTKFLRMLTEDETLFIKSDEITGIRFALAKKTGGSYNCISDFMSYKEMDCYFFGMLHVKQYKLIF